MSQPPFLHYNLSIKLNLMLTDILEQGWANSCPRAKCGLPQRFSWPTGSI